MQSQTTNNILMIRPVNFRYNLETAESNKFQSEEAIRLNELETQKAAEAEFDAMVDQLQLAGVNVLVYDDIAEPFTPDSVFPNNWVSFHFSGKVVLYPMMAPNRRAERRMDIIEDLQKKYHVDVILDFSHFEKQGKYLEGTGSLVLDRMNRIAYACISQRTNEEVLKAWEKQMNGYQIVKFKADDENGNPIYHTNVMMCIGHTFAVVCLDAITDLDERLMVRETLEKTNKYIIEISFEQMNNFAGNMLLVKKHNGLLLLVMSSAAYRSLSKKQVQLLNEFAEIMHIDLGMIEQCGGGSARCMMAEIHLPEKI